jgi:hypothetical protein
MNDLSYPWKVKNIKFLGSLFGMDDIINQSEAPGFIFKFDYYGYSDLYVTYDIKEDK